MLVIVDINIFFNSGFILFTMVGVSVLLGGVEREIIKQVEFSD